MYSPEMDIVYRMLMSGSGEKERGLRTAGSFLCFGRGGGVRGGGAVETLCRCSHIHLASPLFNLVSWLVLVCVRASRYFRVGVEKPTYYKIILFSIMDFNEHLFDAAGCKAHDSHN